MMLLIFRFENPMDRVVRFRPKVWAKIWLGPSDFEIRFYPIGFGNIGLHKKTDPFIRSKSKNLKLGIGSRKNQPYFDDLIWWYRVDVMPILPKYPVQGWCFTERSEVSGTGIDVVPIPVPAPVQTGIEVVPNSPKCLVPILMSYRIYRSVRYRY